MATKFNLTAQLQLQAPRNTAQVVSQIQRQLSGVNVPVNVVNSSRATQQLKQVNNQTKKVTTQAQKMGKAFGVATRRFAAFSVAARGITLFTSSLANAVDESIQFQRELIKISQVTGKTLSELRGLTDTISNLSTSLGVSSKSLLSTGRILSQAGIQAKELEIALSTLAKTTLAPTFDDITKTTEGAVAIIAQFKEGVGALERQLGSINAVAGQFAVESGDLISAVRRTGGVFKAAGGDLEELLALFTSVRATTRESSESIATGLRTIFTRIQRPKTIEFLKQYGVELTDLEGKFVGPYEAVRRLSLAFADLEEGDVTFVKVAEELGGFRQIGKVIPLIKEFSTAEKARQAALAGGESLTKDAAAAQLALAIQFQKVKEEFYELIRAITETSTFQALVKTSLNLASALIKVADAIKPLIPLIGAFAAFKVAKGIGGFAAGIGAGLRGTKGFNTGGLVPGSGNRDTVPAMLTPGEFVIRKSSVKSLGAGTLAAMNNNRYADGGKVKKTIADKLTSAESQRRVYREKSNLEGRISNKKIQLNPKDTFNSNILEQTFASKIPQGYINAGKKLKPLDFERYVSLKLTNSVKNVAGGNAPIDIVKGVDVPTEVRLRKSKSPPSQLIDKLIRAYTSNATKNTGQSKLSLNEDNLSLGPLRVAYPSRNVISKTDARRINLKQKPAKKKATGGGVSDTVPALLTPGEFVINKKAASQIGAANLNRMNTKGVQGFARGGFVGVQKFAKGGGAAPSKAAGDAAGGLANLATAGFVASSVLESMRPTIDENSTAMQKLADVVIGATTKIAIFGSLAGGILPKGSVKGFKELVFGGKKTDKTGGTVLKGLKKEIKDLSNAIKANRKKTQSVSSRETNEARLVGETQRKSREAQRIKKDGTTTDLGRRRRLKTTAGFRRGIRGAAGRIQGVGGKISSFQGFGKRGIGKGIAGRVGGLVSRGGGALAGSSTALAGAATAATTALGAFASGAAIAVGSVSLLTSAMDKLSGVHEKAKQAIEDGNTAEAGKAAVLSQAEKDANTFAKGLAVTGAAVGTAFGPIGSIVGGLVGGLVGLGAKALGVGKLLGKIRDSKVGRFFGAESTKLIAARATVEAQAIKNQKEFADNAKEAATAMEDVQSGVRSFKEAFESGELTRNAKNQASLAVQQRDVSVQTAEESRSGFSAGLSSFTAGLFGTSAENQERNVLRDSGKAEEAKRQELNKVIDENNKLFSDYGRNLITTGDASTATLSNFKDEVAKQLGISVDEIDPKTLADLEAKFVRNAKEIAANTKAFAASNVGLQGFSNYANGASAEIGKISSVLNGSFNSVKSSSDLLAASLSGAQVSDKSFNNALDNLVAGFEDFGIEEQSINKIKGNVTALRGVTGNFNSAIASVAKDVAGGDIKPTQFKDKILDALVKSAPEGIFLE